MFFVVKFSPILICYNFPDFAFFFLLIEKLDFFFFLKTCYSNVWTVKEDKTLMEKAIVWAMRQIFTEKLGF